MTIKKEGKNFLRGLLAKVFLKLLYLTPFGYCLDLIELESGKKIPGIKVDLGDRRSPVSATIKANPTLRERINWFVNGTVLLLQSLFIWSRPDIDDIAGVYGIIALIWALVCIVSSIFPGVQWDKKIGR